MAIDAAAQASSATISPIRIGVCSRLNLASVGASISMAESAASSEASSSPTGVASTKPPFGPPRTTPGVASACRARKPALVNSTMLTRNSRSSPLRRATSLTMRPSATLRIATPSTNQKCDG